MTSVGHPDAEEGIPSARVLPQKEIRCLTIVSWTMPCLTFSVCWN